MCLEVRNNDRYRPFHVFWWDFAGEVGRGLGSFLFLGGKAFLAFKKSILVCIVLLYCPWYIEAGNRLQLERQNFVKVELQRCMLDLLRWLLIFLPGRRVFDIPLNNLFCNWTKEKMFELFLLPRQTPRCYTGIEYTKQVNFRLFSKR